MEQKGVSIILIIIMNSCILPEPDSGMNATSSALFPFRPGTIIEFYLGIFNPEDGGG